MLKKTFLSMMIFSFFLCTGCQKTLFEEEKPITSSVKNAIQTNEGAWIYVPSTRTIKNTMVNYAGPLEFDSDGVIITENLPKAKNLKPELESDLNAFIENLSSNFGDAVLSDMDFSVLHEQTNLAEDILQNRISIEGALSFIGPYASIQLTATPSIINQNTNEMVELNYIEENTYYLAKFYNVKEKREAALNELFLEDKSYITLLQRYIQNKILMESPEPFDTLKRSFSNLSENDFSLYYDSGIDTDVEPHFVLTLNEQNPYCIGEQRMELSLALFMPYFSFSPNDIENIIDVPNLLTKKMIDTTDTFIIEQNNSITIDGCDNTLFIAIKDYKTQNITERINEQLDTAQRIYADTSPILDYISKADDASFRVLSYKGLGPFLKVFIMSDATVNGQHLFNQKNILIHMPTGEQLAVRDLLSQDSMDNLTELQSYYLDSTDFTLENSGRIVVPLQPPAEDGTMNLVYESKLFDFSKYSNF